MNSDPRSTAPGANRFAQTDEEAASRFEKYTSVDPFPEIPPALLNSADVEDYVAATGMIWRFYPGSEKAKPASYEVDLLGKCVYWDEEGKKQIKTLERGDEFTLKRNSIAFVTLEPMFRLPDYIALRFNLKITHVYRGILLGTGPLVDPGYANKLSIPLHNLTTNDYVFRGGDPLIWMEFTKLSPIQGQSSEGRVDELPTRQGKYQRFPKRKNELSDVEDYLRKADPHRSIRSSIPEVILSAQTSAEQSAQASKEAAKSAKDAADKAESLRFRATLGGIISGLAFLIALVAVVFQVYSLTQDAISYVKQNAQFSNEEQKERFQNLEREIQNLKQQLGNLTRPSVPFPSSVSPTIETPKTDAQ